MRGRQFRPPFVPVVVFFSTLSCPIAPPQTDPTCGAEPSLFPTCLPGQSTPAMERVRNTFQLREGHFPGVCGKLFRIEPFGERNTGVLISAVDASTVQNIATLSLST